MTDTQLQVLSLYDTYANTLFRHCYLRILNREKAKKILNHAFRRLSTYIEDGREVKDLSLLLYRIVNALIQLYRKDARNMNRPVLAEKMSPEDRTLLLQLSQLEEKTRDAVVLHFVDEFTLKRTAGFLKESIPATQKILDRGLERMEELVRQ